MRNLESLEVRNLKKEKESAMTDKMFIQDAQGWPQLSHKLQELCPLDKAVKVFMKSKNPAIVNNYNPAND